MIIIASADTDYGQLKPLVATVGIIVSSTAAIVMGFKGRARWEPVQEDVPKGPQKVASLITSIGIILLWIKMNDPKMMDKLINLAVIFGSLTVVSLLFYSWLISVCTYIKIFSPKTNTVLEGKIIGGFRLIESAKEELKKGVSVQQLFAGRGYEEDLVWTRSSRALAKLLFIVAYIGLYFFGTLALTAIALMLLLNHPSKLS